MTENMMILNMLDEDKITVAEAERLLLALTEENEEPPPPQTPPLLPNSFEMSAQETRK